LEFSGGFTDLHTVSYQEILKGNGYEIEAPRQAIEIVHDVRHAKPIGAIGDFHPFVKKSIAKHPFQK
jgi:UDP-N-acetyl-2-amino-2-deoxyglucuronate dehydrogenase